MLRTIQNRYSLPRLLSFVSSNNGSAVTASWGALLGTYSRPSQGVNRLTLNSPHFHRLPVLVCSPGAGASLGGYGVLGADPTRSVLDPKALDDGGSAEDEILHSLCLGWLSSTTDIWPKRQIHTVFNQPRYIGLAVTGAASPTISIGKADATVALTGATAGDYTITFNRPFNTVPNAVVTLSGASGGARIESITRSTVRVICGSPAGAAAHKSFNLHVLGSDSMVEQHDLRRAVKATHVKPELIGFHISVAGGTPSLTIGSNDASVVDDGVGQFTVTLGSDYKRDASLRTLIPIATATNRVHLASIDHDSFQLNCTDAAGSAEDPTDVQGIILAYGVADSEYYQG